MQNVQPTHETDNDETSEGAEALTLDRVLHALTWDPDLVELELAHEIEAMVEVVRVASRSGEAHESIEVVLGGVERRAGLLGALLEERRQKQADANRAALTLAEGGA